MASKKQTSEEVEIQQINTGQIDFCILGRTPLIINRLTEKAKMELLLPKGRKTAADKANTLKHNPYDEFRSSPYTAQSPDAETYIEFLATAFKGAIRGAGVDIPGSSKAQLGRLLWVNGERVSIYGAPKMMMSIVRQAGINKTPDVRSRCIVPQWACKLSVSFVQPLLSHKTVANLLAAAGMIQGVGDWRPEKGSGTFGQFELVEENDERFQSILKIGYQPQFKAIQSPEPYDGETEELLSWFDDEIDRRGIKTVKGAA